MTLVALPHGHVATRTVLQRIGTHVMARARHAATSRFGLRATAGGFGTPAFGPDNEVVRVSGGLLVVDRAGENDSSTHSRRITGSSLAELAGFVGVTLDPDFSVGGDTPDMGDPDEVLTVDAAVSEALGAWLAVGTRALDETVAELGPAAAATSFQLWPEHFDLGGNALVGSGRVNFGVSHGDQHHEAPYIYVAPWDDRRPGDAAYWSAPFGAVLPYEALAREPDPVGAAVEWIGRGVAALRAV
jgi:hypothetical protein